MVLLTNTVTEAGQSVTCDSLRKTGNSEYVNGSGSSQVFLRAGGLYLVDFNANVTNADAATAVQLQLELNGSPLPETLRIFTPSAINAVGTIAFSTAVSTAAGCNFNLGSLSVTVTNTGDATVTVSNPALRIGRIG